MSPPTRRLYKDNVSGRVFKKLGIEFSVIPRLDRGIQAFETVLDCPVKPDNDKAQFFGDRLTVLPY